MEDLVSKNAGNTCKSKMIENDMNKYCEDLQWKLERKHVEVNKRVKNIERVRNTDTTIRRERHRLQVMDLTKRKGLQGDYDVSNCRFNNSFQTYYKTSLIDR